MRQDTPPPSSQIAPELAIIVVSWNVRALLAGCLESLQAQFEPQARLGGLRTEVIVVDNASTDGSAEMVGRHFPYVRLIANAHNPGFAGGNNQAMRELAVDAPQRTESSLRYVLLLNPDTVVHGQAVATLVRFMENTPQAGVCGARLVYGDGAFQHSAFAFPGLAQIALDLWPIQAPLVGGRLLDSRLNGRYPRRWYAAGWPFEVDHPLGATLMARVEAVAQVGLMDEGFHMYCEEIDWCWRIKRAGWKIYCVPQAEIVHYGGQSTTQARPEMVVALWRSRRRLYSKYYPAWKRYLADRLVQVGARWRARQTAHAPALADAYRQVDPMFSERTALSARPGCAD